MQDYYGGYNPYPYIYIQFSHDDADRVLPIINALVKENYNILYDDNYEEDDRYRYLNARKMTQAAAFMLFYSKSAAKSRLIKECVRFAVPMYNLDKICVCIDDAKFGFSFTDLKRNYTIIDEEDNNGLLTALKPYLDIYSLPSGVLPSVRTEKDLTEVDEPDELEEIGDSSEEVEEIAEETGFAPEEAVEELESAAEAVMDKDDFSDGQTLPQETARDTFEPPFHHPAEEMPSGGFFRRRHSHQSFPEPQETSDNSPDVPEVFPDFELSDDFFDDDESFAIPSLTEPEPASEPVAEELPQPEPESVPEPIAEELPEPQPEPIAEELSQPEPIAEELPQPEPEPESVPEPIAEELSQPEPVSEPVAEPAQNDSRSDVVWENLRRKMHVRAMKKTRLFIKPAADSQVIKTKQENVHSSYQLDYPQDDTIETITIKYPTDEDISEISTSPKPIKLNQRLSIANPDKEIVEITHKPETVDSRPLYGNLELHDNRSSIELTPLFTDNPPPSEVLPIPVNEPQTDIGRGFSFDTVRTPEQERYESIIRPEPEPDSDEPSEDDLPETQQAAGQNEPETRYEPEYEDDLSPFEEDEPDIQTGDLSDEDEAEPEPEQPKEEEPQAEDSFDDTELNSYEFFTQNILSEMDSDSIWDGESFFAEQEAPQPDPGPDSEPELPVTENPVPVGTYPDETISFAPVQNKESNDAKNDEEEEFKAYEEFIEKQENVEKQPQQVDIKTQILIKAAEQGNADAQYKLGSSYEHGDRVEQNYVKAAHWYILSSNRGNANAQFNLANMYEHGLGVSKNLYEAAELYRAAAEQGHSNAQTHYGLCLKSGVGTEQNPSEAVKWFVKASEKGNAVAIYNLGVCFECGEGVDKDFSHALQLYLASANQNYAEAQNALANCYMSGTGVPANYTEAVRWYSKAARGGNVAAQFNIGFCCENGLGIDKNTDMAFRFYRIAANNGSESALRRLRELGFVEDAEI